jgi:hypothetical protein
MQNYRETTKDVETTIDATKLTIPKGTELIRVSDCGGASGYAVKSEALLVKLGAWEHDARTRYAYIPEHAVFEALHVREPVKTKSDDWQETAHKWAVKIAGQEFEYYTGALIKDPPNYDSVMACLVRDAEALNQTFENWALEFGYDTDSRKAYAIWEACCENARKLILAGIDIEAEAERLRDY